MKLLVLAAAAFGLSITAPVAAQTFNGVCASTATSTQAACTTSGFTPTVTDYGNTAQLNSTTDPTLKVLVSAWQINQSNNAISKAYLGAYGGGFGVTGLGDNGGANNLHQIDNITGYTDFVLLQFSKAVTLTGLTENLYQLPGVTGTHGDFSVANGNAVTPTVWNGAIDLTTKLGSAFNFKDVTGVSGTGQTGGSVPFSAIGGSQVWLLSASALATNRDDGFKLASLNVTPQAAVPEPATWAMLIMGFGAIGLTLRRRERTAGPATA